MLRKVKALENETIKKTSLGKYAKHLTWTI